MSETAHKKRKEAEGEGEQGHFKLKLHRNRSQAELGVPVLVLFHQFTPIMTRKKEVLGLILIYFEWLLS